jgi:hypothetical protein
MKEEIKREWEGERKGNEMKEENGKGKEGDRKTEKTIGYKKTKKGKQDKTTPLASKRNEYTTRVEARVV